MRSLKIIQQAVQECKLCPRLRGHCEKTAVEKRRAYAGETYWGKPVMGFGDPSARLVVVGLAPGAHGANRTGRVFTGDRSGEWLYRALYKAGFANQAESRGVDDGLVLHNAYVTCVVKCAPPDNKPDREEEIHCRKHLVKELATFENAQVWIALGQFAMKGLWNALGWPKPIPKFAHGKIIELKNAGTVILSYHPSQQNTFTGRLTEPMFDSVFQKAREIL